MKYLAPGSQLVRGEQGQELDPKPRAHAYTPLLLRMCVCLASIFPVAPGGAGGWYRSDDAGRLGSEVQTIEYM